MPKPCSIGGCHRPAHARGWCGTHYAMWARTGLPTAATRIRRPCMLCNSPSYCQGLCTLHYQRWRQHGTTDDPRVPFSERFWANTDPSSNGCLIWRGLPDAAGYGRVSRDGLIQYAHRAAYELAHGPIPQSVPRNPGLDPTVDHLCRVRRCVNPMHLELVSLAENVRRGNAARRSA